MKSLQGHLLIASPKLLDPNFFHSIVLIIQHGEDGAFGLVLNHPLEMTVQAAWEQVSETPTDVEGVLHQGGPCEGPLMVVHTRPDCADLQVLDGVYFCTEDSKIRQLIDETGEMKFFLNCSGWSPGQLEKEIEEGSWLVIPAAAEQIFSTDDQWEPLFKTLTRLATAPYLHPKVIPDDPTMN